MEHKKCCFISQQAMEFSFGLDEDDSRCIATKRLIRADSNFLDLIRLFPTAFLTSNPYPYNVMCAVM